jgi:hypothetical protein
MDLAAVINTIIFGCVSNSGTCLPLKIGTSESLLVYRVIRHVRSCFDTRTVPLAGRMRLGDPAGSWDDSLKSSSSTEAEKASLLLQEVLSRSTSSMTYSIKPPFDV